MLIAEELLFVTARPSGWDMVGYRDVAVAGALLAELAVRERVDVVDNRLRLLDGSSTGDPLLDEALVRLTAVQGKKPKDVLGRVGKGLPQLVLERLAAAELVQARPVRALGMTLRTSWVPVDVARLAALRQELLLVLTGRQAADSRTGALVSLLLATEGLDDALPKDARQGVPFGELKRSAKEISQGRWASEAVGAAVAAAASAAATATSAAVIASS